MKIKKLTLIFLAFVTLILSMGIICASANITDLQTPENNIDVAVSTNTQDTSVLKENSTSTQPEQTTPAKTTTQPVVKNKIKTKVEADQKAVKYKKSTYFKVKVEDRYDDDIPDGIVLVHVAGNDTHLCQPDYSGDADPDGARRRRDAVSG